MEQNLNNQIYSSRLLKAPLAKVYKAFETPEHLTKWWGPEGFTNTFHEFDLRPNGTWKLTMHGPDKGHYENEAVFTIVEPMRLIAWRRVSKPLFNMEVTFESISALETKIAFRMLFDTAEECNKIKAFAIPKNEENFDRLEKELSNVLV
ncbi:SRPBCC family protein [Mariniflexile jejuense]|uniref:SRPBCC family protein n=1 Tax=Mariniflexile jejuense TaxID=1173582 RepID=A0ABW3JH48_9FLAO